MHDSKVAADVAQVGYLPNVITWGKMNINCGHQRGLIPYKRGLTALASGPSQSTAAATSTTVAAYCSALRVRRGVSPVLTLSGLNISSNHPWSSRERRILPCCFETLVCKLWHSCDVLNALPQQCNKMAISALKRNVLVSTIVSAVSKRFTKTSSDVSSIVNS